MKCLIVSKTHAGSSVCVGGLAADGSNLRLTEQVGFPFLSRDTQYKIGQLYELEYTQCQDVSPPHIEDVLVTSHAFLGSYSNLSEILPRLVRVWEGGIHELFEDEIRGPSQSGSGYIDEGNIPSQSVGFWCPSQDFTGEAQVSPYTGNTRYRYQYGLFSLPYVGVDTPPKHISAGSLVRVSLARWFKPPNASDDFPKRCYLQISGFY